MQVFGGVVESLRQMNFLEPSNAKLSECEVQGGLPLRLDQGICRRKAAEEIGEHRKTQAIPLTCAAAYFAGANQTKEIDMPSALLKRSAVSVAVGIIIAAASGLGPASAAPTRFKSGAKNYNVYQKRLLPPNPCRGAICRKRVGELTSAPLPPSS